MICDVLIVQVLVAILLVIALLLWFELCLGDSAPLGDDDQ